MAPWPMTLTFSDKNAPKDNNDVIEKEQNPQLLQSCLFLFADDLGKVTVFVSYFSNVLNMDSYGNQMM